MIHIIKKIFRKEIERTSAVRRAVPNKTFYLGNDLYTQDLSTGDFIKIPNWANKSLELL